MAEDVYDLTIIGGGPTGLYAAYYAGLRQMKTKLIEALPELGGQLAALYPEKDIFDVAGFRRVQAKRLVAEMSRQGLVYGPAICLGERVESLDLPPEGTPEAERVITLGTNSGRHLSRVVLIAAGVGAFSPRRLEVPGVAELEGHGVYYFVRDLEHLIDRRVLIAGGGDSAVDWALALAERAEKVTLIHRRDGFRAHEDSVTQLRQSPVEVRTFWELARVEGDGAVEAAEIYSNRSEERERLAVDTVILSLGFKADLGPIGRWGLELSKGGVVVDEYMRTNLPGVYAAGDIAEHPAKLKLIATGFAEAAIAVNFGKAALDPAARAFPGHSSELGK